MLAFILVLIFISLAAALTWFLISHDKGETEPVSALWMAAGLGLLGGLAAGLLEVKLLPNKDLTVSTTTGLGFGAAMVVGAIEELCKFVPLASVIYRKGYFNEYTDGIIYFALAGMGFGLPENILYTLEFGAKTGLARLLLTPLFHAATTAIVGYFLIRGKLAKSPVWKVVIPLAIMAALHGVYDYGLGSDSALFQQLSISITICLSFGLFALYYWANELDRRRGYLAKNPGMAHSGNARISLVLGILAIAGVWVSVALGLLLGIAGVITGSISYSKRRHISLAGILLSTLAIIISLAAGAAIFQH